MAPLDTARSKGESRLLCSRCWSRRRRRMDLCFLGLPPENNLRLFVLHLEIHVPGHIEHETAVEPKQAEVE